MHKATVRQEKRNVTQEGSWPDFPFELEDNERIIHSEIKLEKHELSTGMRTFSCMATIVKEEKRQGAIKC